MDSLQNERTKGSSVRGGGEADVIVRVDRVKTEEDAAATRMRLRKLAEQIAQGVTSCWSEAANDANRLAPIDQEKLAQLSTHLRNVSADVRDLRSEHELKVERTENLAQNQEDLSARLALSEERFLEVATITRRIEKSMRRATEAQEELREQIVNQYAAICRLEQAVRTHTESIENRLTDAVAQIAHRVESVVRAQEVHADTIAKLGAAWSHINDLQQSFEQRVEGQARAIQSIHSATRAQAALWAELKLTAVHVREAIRIPSGELLTPSETDLERL
ncbi:MAG TPA: hypothetical protein VLE22_22760 [Bryobacteraceae bacterium]|nr:hypothetical protein [Bryobacteraceae bacterium]